MPKNQKKAATDNTYVKKNVPSHTFGYRETVKPMPHKYPDPPPHLQPPAHKTSTDNGGDYKDFYSPYLK